MTTNPSIKRAIRERIKTTGEPYVVARRIIIEESNKNNPQIISESNTPPINKSFNTIPKLPSAIPGQVTIAVTAATAGVGKTTTAICLAGTISKKFLVAGESKKVVVVDLDLHQGKVGSLIGQYMPTAVSIKVMPEHGTETILQNLVADKELMIDALLAPIRPRNADDMGVDFYENVIKTLQTTHDVVILVLPCDYKSPISILGFGLSDEILVVTTLATTNVELMSRMLLDFFEESTIEGVRIQRNKVGIVANMVVANVGMGKEKLLRAALGVPLVGQIPAEYNFVLASANSNHLRELLSHEGLGVAYNNLAIQCIPRLIINSYVKTIISSKH